MTRTLAHRGPDAEGYFFQNQGANNIGLGHRRLSILDLTDSANQPMHSCDNRYQLVYNGEIYNFKEVKSAINKSNWKTSGDTEVILEAFIQWGPSFVEKLNGMFSIAIWDSKEYVLHLFRDRLGIKPLYYMMDEDSFIFASELKAITKLVPKEKLELNQEAIEDFLHLGYIGKDASIFKNINKFPSGSIGLYSDSKLEISSYWKADEKLDPVVNNNKENQSKLNDLLLKSVEYRMIADVPVGIFLSGGTDSSTVAAMAQHLSEQPVQTFSIGFKENKHNESEHAKAVAQQLGSQHHEFILSHQDAIEQFEKILRIYDEPFADTSAVPTLMVSEMARQQVTVALSGDGGDELFMGYGMYNWAKRLSNPVIYHSRHAIAQLLSLGDNRMKRAAEVFNFSSKDNVQSHIFSQEQYFFSKTAIGQLLKGSVQNNADNFEKTVTNRVLSPREAQALFDLKNYLKDDLLVKVDRASMHHSLEVRVPLLDHNVVEFALNLSEKEKVYQGNMKHLLKEVLYTYVPKKILDRPKWGFSIPLKNWLSKELKYLIDQYLEESVVESVGLVRYREVHRLKTQFLNGHDYLYNKVWLLILLHRWMKEMHQQ